MDGPYCTTETLNTDKTESRTVVYPWHPFYGKAVEINGERNRRGTIVYVCTSDGSDAGAVMEVPAWMFDPAVCCLLRSADHARVHVGALRALQVLLNQTCKLPEDVVKAHQSTISGGDDAQTSKGGCDSNRAVSDSCFHTIFIDGAQPQDRTASRAVAPPARKAKTKPAANECGGSS